MEREGMASRYAWGGSGWAVGTMPSPKEWCCSCTGSGRSPSLGMHQSCGDAALRDVDSGHSGLGLDWGSERSLPTMAAWFCSMSRLHIPAQPSDPVKHVLHAEQLRAHKISQL